MIKNIFWNTGERRVRAVWRQLIQLVLFAVLSGVLVRGVGALAGVHPAPAGGLQAAPARYYLTDLPLTEVLSAAAALLSIWLMARFINREPLALFGLRFDRAWWLDSAFGLLLGLALTAAVFLVELAAGWVTVTGTFRSGVAGVPFGLAILGPIVLVVGAAFFEEPYYRGYWIRNLAQGLPLRLRGPARGLGMVALWVISSAYFGWGHRTNPYADPLGVVNIGLAGILFGLSYLLTGSLGLSIGLHFGWDFCQGAVFGTPVAGLPLAKAASVLTVARHGPALWTGGGFGTDEGLLVTLAFVLGLLPVLLYIRLRYGQIRLYTPLAEYAPRTDAVSAETETAAQPTESTPLMG